MLCGLMSNNPVCRSIVVPVLFGTKFSGSTNLLLLNFCQVLSGSPTTRYAEMNEFACSTEIPNRSSVFWWTPARQLTLGPSSSGPTTSSASRWSRSCSESRSSSVPSAAFDRLWFDSSEPCRLPWPTARPSNSSSALAELRALPPNKIPDSTTLAESSYPPPNLTR